jgi:NAD(P)-dependent dehydrogenase (short-subunit alcohol dehydrogenase family)
MSDQLRLDGQVAFVTGGTSGLGQAYCQMLASRGAKVIVNGNFRPEGVGPEKQVAEEIRAQGGEAIGVNGSVYDNDAVERMIAEAIDAYGRLDILVNNAGTLDITMNVLKGPDQRLYDQFEIHVAAPMRMVRAVWKHLVASGHGRIVNTGSSSPISAMPTDFNALSGPAFATPVATHERSFR